MGKNRVALVAGLAKQQRQYFYAAFFTAIIGALIIIGYVLIVASSKETEYFDSTDFIFAGSIGLLIILFIIFFKKYSDRSRAINKILK